MSGRKIAISTDAALTTGLPFSQGVRKGPMLQVSGQGAMDPRLGCYVGVGDVEAQTLRALENVRAIMEAGGAGFEDVIMICVYLTGHEGFAPMNLAYSDFVAEYVPSGSAGSLRPTGS